jgi:DNA-directed RNA polymerase II subunit RPB2
MVHSKTLREVIDALFWSSDSFLATHQIESFNSFIDELIETIIKQYNPITIYGVYNEEYGKHEHEIRMSFSNALLQSPMIYEIDGSMSQMSPKVALQRSMSYSSNLHTDVLIETTSRSGYRFENEEVKTKTLEKILIGKIPIMVKSRYCNGQDSLTSKENCQMDIGGYFIITGSEKVIIAQERQAENKIFCFPVSAVASSKFTHCVEVKSVPPTGFMPAKPTSIKTSNRVSHHEYGMYVQIQSCKKEIPLVILFRALGVDTDRAVCDNVFGTHKPSIRKELEDMLRTSIDEAEGITQPMALEYIAKYLPVPMRSRQGRQVNMDMRIAHVRTALANDFLPHLGTDYTKKAFFLGLMSLKLLMFVTGRISEDDRDSFENKRVDTAGIMLANLFRQSFTKLIKDATVILAKEISSGPWKLTDNFHNIVTSNNIYKILKSNIIETNLKYSLATGNWGVKNTTVKVGVAQVLQRLSYLGTLSHLRRINTPIDKTTKMTKPRKLHSSTYGYICPAETPEGASIGIVKNMAISCGITSDISHSHVLKFVESDESFIPIGHNKPRDTAVFINGIIYGTIDNMVTLQRALVNYRRHGIIHCHTSIVPMYNDFELHIYTSAGRLVRPVFIVENGNLVFNDTHIKFMRENRSSWIELVLGTETLDPAIEYLDVQESSSCLICEHPNNIHQNKKYTHCDIDPSLILGILASNIVFSNHNQSPRNTYQSAMGKQAMGIYATNFLYRMDMVTNILWYPTRPIVMTHNSKHMNMDKIPNGSVVIIAVCSDKGYNQEDSLMFNRSAIERGLFRSSFFRTYHVEERKNQSTGEEEQFAKPDPNNTLQMRHCSYDALDNNGFPIEGKRVKGGDAIVGKIIPMNNRKKTSTVTFDKEYRDNSTYVRNNEDGVVDKTFVSRNSDGYVFCKAKIRTERTPQIGDKFSSTHGQKGTIGMIYNAEDMPYTADGLVPDIIMNPHAFPSRMTFAQLLESLLGIECLDKGMYGDGTPFNNITVKSIATRLEKSGYDKYGESVLYSGEKGEKLQTSIFMGPTFYQRLKHMVDDKFHARSTGPMVQLTRQPSEGRSRDGGLRIGEMERDCLLSHGAAQFQKEKFMELSDAFTVHLNPEGFMCAVNKKEKTVNSLSDVTNDNNGKVTEHRIPYATKLFLHELQAMGISARLHA